MKHKIAPPLKIYDAWKIIPLSSSELNSMQGKEKMIYFAKWGLLAPTTHNTVPQKFKISENEIKLYLDKNLVLPESDRDSRQAMISLGCIAENIIQSAQAYGLSPANTLQKKPLKGNLLHVLTIKISKTTSIKIDHDILKSMLNRRIERGQYKEKDKLAESLKEKINKEISGLTGISLELIENRHTKQMLSIIQRQADTFSIGIPKFREEFSNWFLPNKDTKKTRGMRGHEFNLNDKVASHIHEGLKKGNLSLIEMLSFSKLSQEGMQSASAIAIISGQDDLSASRLKAGMAYEKIALLLEQNGYSTAVHAALTETGIPAIKAVSNTLKSTILKTKGHPLVIYRIGIPKSTKRKLPSSKPPIESLLI